MEASPTSKSLFNRAVGWAFRSALVLGVVTMALVGFQMGVEVSDRDVGDVGLWAHIYYAIGLFVFGGLDLGTPHGGPFWARALVWMAYFLAPLLTVGAIVIAVIRALTPALRSRKPLQDHIVIVGYGQLGQLYHQVLRGVEPNRQLVVVDLDPARGEALAGSPTMFVRGDIIEAEVRAEANLGQAAGVVLLTENDLANLEAATVIVDGLPSLRDRIAIHLTDIGMKRTLDQQLTGPGTGSFDVESLRLGDYKLPPPASDDAALADLDERGILPVSRTHVFNGHRIAARHLVLSHLMPHFKRTKALDVVVIAGFGRFGQTVLELMQREASGEYNTVIIADPEADLCARVFNDQVGFKPGYRMHLVNGPQDDPQTWERVKSHIDTTSAKEPVYVLASNQDTNNLRRAIWLRDRFPNARVLVRCFEETAFTRKMSERMGFDVFGMSGLLRESLAKRHRLWFGPPG